MATRVVRSFGSIVVAFFAACAPHLEPIESDRPDETESTGLVPTGMVQAEGGATLIRSDDVHGVTIGETLIRIGVSRRIELRVEPLTLTTLNDGAGNTDFRTEAIVLGMKTPLYRRPEHASVVVPDLAAIVGTSVSGIARGLAGADPEATLAAQWELSDAASAGANLAARREREGGESHWERKATATLGLTLSERTGSYVEWYGSGNGGDQPWRQVLNAGLTYRLSGDFQLDARVGKGMNEPGGFVGVGMAARW